MPVLNFPLHDPQVPRFALELYDGCGWVFLYAFPVEFAAWSIALFHQVLSELARAAMSGGLGHVPISS